MYQYTIAMMGYGLEDKSAVLELTYNYGVMEYDKGNGYAQVNSQPFPKCVLLYFRGIFKFQVSLRIVLSETFLALHWAYCTQLVSTKT